MDGMDEIEIRKIKEHAWDAINVFVRSGVSCYDDDFKKIIRLYESAEA